MSDSPAPSSSSSSGQAGVLPPAIAAVIVTFHPGRDVVANFDAIAGQVDRLLVVDNGSTPQELAALSTRASAHGADVIRNRENRGIAEALNQAVEWAERAGTGWLLMLDQDSRPPADFVRKLHEAVAGSAAPDRVAVVAPLYRAPNDEVIYSAAGPATMGAPEIVPVSVAATSGSLVRLAAVRDVGGFRADLFIDFVDFEFCLRCRSRGWLVTEARQAVLEHRQGTVEQRRWLWLRPRINDYDPVRRYYQMRNRLVVYGRFGRLDPAWMWRDAREYGRELAKLLLVGRARWSKLRAMAEGAWDAVAGRRGPWRRGDGSPS